MKINFLLPKALLLVLLPFYCSLAANAQTTVKGTVLDAESDAPLIGAHVMLAKSSTGTKTAIDGQFMLELNQQPPFTLTITYLGYDPKEILVTETQPTLNIRLQPNYTLTSEVVISASRRPEKVQEAPAAINIVSAEQIANDAVGNPFLSLRNVVGVDVGQAGVSSGMITLRGSASVFQTETFVMVDYRNLVLPGLGTLGYGQQPIDPIDLARVEVVKGPGSALYGPGVESGVIHFISKDPFQYPGTTLSIGGGTRNAFEASVRHAATNKAKTLGYKVLGFYRTARDWELNPNDPVDSAHLATFQEVVVSALTGEPVFTEIPDYFTESIGFTGTLEYRPTTQTSIVGTGGWSMGQFIFRTAQGEGYVTAPRPFAQLRLQSGGLFAQAFWSNHDGSDGNSGLYPTGLTTITESHQFEGQLQYNFLALNDKVNFTTGADYRLNTVDTKGTVHGRYEDDDDFTIYGAYLQGDATLTNKLSLIAAGRVDRFVALEATSFSPRLGLVYKAAPAHTFRVTFNRAVGAPTSLNLYADLPLANAGAYMAHLLGGAQPVTFTESNTTSFLPGNPVYDGIGQQLAPVYGVLTAGIAASGALPESLIEYLTSLTPSIPGASAGAMSMAPRSRGKLELSQSNMFEVGYKGTFNGKLGITIDAYYNMRNNMLSAPIQASPVVVQPTLGADLAAAVAATVDPAVLANYGLTPEQVAGIYQNAAQSISANPDGSFRPLGVVRSDQTPPASPLPTIDLAYYNISQIEYGGIDVALNYWFTKNFSAMGSVSWLSNNLFDEVEIGEGETAATTNFSLNVPDTKLKFSLDYLPESGLNSSLAVRYTSAWTAISGAPFTGPVDAFTVVDLGAGYRFKYGLNLSVMATNLFEEEYRFIYGAPKIGRQILARATYSFGGKEK